jgi:hypothetical protein
LDFAFARGEGEQQRHRSENRKDSTEHAFPRGPSATWFATMNQLTFAATTRGSCL